MREAFFVFGVGGDGAAAPRVWDRDLERVARGPRRPRDIFRWKRWWGSRRTWAGADHHFRFVQLPFNLAMPEALTRPTQSVGGKLMPMVQAARNLGIALVTSAALLQGQLAKSMPAFCAGGAGAGGRAVAGDTICEVGAGVYDGAGGDEQRGAREGECEIAGSGADGKRAIYEDF